ncbi:MAG: hypothetical protein ABSF90_26155 [Syntrophobacteraceae bacterium]|jgi:hypothetical protein
MKRPTWVTVAGVMGIVFGVFGLISSSQTLLIPKIFQMQKEMISGMEKSFQNQPEKQRGFEEFKSMTDKMFGEAKPWSSSVFVSIGIIGILINSIYIFTSISLILLKKFAIRMFYITMVLSIAFAIVRMASALMVQTAMGWALATSPIPGLVIDIILLVIIIIGNKQAFYEKQDSIA